MSDRMICRTTMNPCHQPDMCSPWGGCPPVAPWPAPAGVEVEITRLRAENERLTADLNSMSFAHTIAEADVTKLRAALTDAQWGDLSRTIDRFSAGEISDLVALGLIGRIVFSLNEKRQAALGRG